MDTKLDLQQHQTFKNNRKMRAKMLIPTKKESKVYKAMYNDLIAKIDNLLMSKTDNYMLLRSITTTLHSENCTKVLVFFFF